MEEEVKTGGTEDGNSGQERGREERRDDGEYMRRGTFVVPFLILWRMPCCIIKAGFPYHVIKSVKAPQDFNIALIIDLSNKIFTCIMVRPCRIISLVSH